MLTGEILRQGRASDSDAEGCRIGCTMVWDPGVAA